jgi:predicted N-acyltransferase
VGEVDPVTALRVVHALRDVPRAAWDALVGDGSPFLEWDWLTALEDSGAATPGTGWLPRHLTLWDGERLAGACPLYVKGHSLGEFVFDQSWASAAARAGIGYYPKLLVAVPFTPVSGARFLAADGVARAGVAATLAAALETICREERLSSAHVNFCLPDEVEALAARGWQRRTGCQYHWTNGGFASFDDYLESLRSKRRNQVRRERRAVAEEGVEITAYTGDEIPDALFPTMYALYRATVDRLPWGQRYLGRTFFALAAERLRHRLCFVVARHEGKIVAGTFNVRKGDALYGRYWGAKREIRHLHFNVCYYAAIEYCIAHGLRRFEPGAGGEFKVLRGFDATPTQSMHWIRDPRLADAVRTFLARERRAVAREIDRLGERTALRRDRQ